METELLTWKERLKVLGILKTIQLTDNETAQAVYSAMRDNADLFKGKTFSVRTEKGTTKQFVIRLK